MSNSVVLFTARYPVYNHLSTTLEGLWTIRALTSEERFLHSFDTLQDRHTAACYTYITTNRWFALILDVFCIVFVAGLTLLSVLVYQFPLTGTDLGLSIPSGSSPTISLDLIFFRPRRVGESLPMLSLSLCDKPRLDVSNCCQELSRNRLPDGRCPEGV